MLRCQLSTREVEGLHQAGAAVSFPLETPAVRSRRAMRASRDTAAALPTRRPSRSAMICRARAPAHTEELLDRRAVEAGGCHGPRGAEDFVKSMKRLVGRAWGELLLYYMLGSDPALWPAGERREGGGYHA